MSAIDGLRATIHERLDAADTALASLSTHGARQVTEVVDASLAPQGVDAAVRAEIANGIVDLLQRALTHGGKTVALQRRLAGESGGSADLRAVAGRVQTGVIDAAIELGPRLQGGSLSAAGTDAWSSNERYVAAIASQRGALDAVPETAKSLERALTLMSDGVEQYYGTLASLATSTTLNLLRLATTISTWQTAVTGILGITSGFADIEKGLAAMRAAALENSESVRAVMAAAQEAPLEWPRGASKTPGA